MTSQKFFSLTLLLLLYQVALYSQPSPQPLAPLLSSLAQASVTIAPDRAPARYLPGEAFKVAIQIANRTNVNLVVPDPDDTKAGGFMMGTAAGYRSEVFDRRVGAGVRTLTLSPGSIITAEHWTDQLFSANPKIPWMMPIATPETPGSYLLVHSFGSSAAVEVIPANLEAQVVVSLHPVVAGAATRYVRAFVLSYLSSNGSRQYSVCVSTKDTTFGGPLIRNTNGSFTQSNARASSPFVTVTATSVPISQLTASADSNNNLTLNIATSDGQNQILTLDGTRRLPRATVSTLPPPIQLSLQRAGSPSARIWTFQFANLGTGTAFRPFVRDVVLLQSGGNRCSPHWLSPFPISPGDVQPGESASTAAVADFSSCSSDARWNVTALYGDAAGSSGSLTCNSVADENGLVGCSASLPPAPTLGISPVLECVKNNGNGTFNARFGYLNRNSTVVTVPVGTNNRFSPNPQDRGQVAAFQPGRIVGAFEVTWPGSGNLVWSLKGPDNQNRTATASSTSQACAP